MLFMLTVLFKKFIFITCIIGLKPQTECGYAYQIDISHSHRFGHARLFKLHDFLINLLTQER